MSGKGLSHDAMEGNENDANEAVTDNGTDLAGLDEMKGKDANEDVAVEEQQKPKRKRKLVTEKLQVHKFYISIIASLLSTLCLHIPV